MRQMVWRATSAQVRYVSVVPPKHARGLVAAVYSQLERDFGMPAPPITLHSPAPQVLAAAWLMLQESLLAAGRVDRAVREAVAVAVSRGNTCPYCVDVHSTLLYGLTPTADVAALADDRVASIRDPTVRAAVEWARAGGVRAPAVRWPATIPVDHAPELLGVLLTFHYLNRMVNVLLRSSPFPPGTADGVRRRLRPLLGAVLARRLRRGRESGAGPDLLAPAALPPDLGWAADLPKLAGALARATAAIETAGRRSVPEPVRDRVLAELARWDGRPPGISRAWVEDAVAGLPEAVRPPGRLALLTVFASYQVDASVVAGFREHRGDDAALVELVSWASLTAARQVAGWADPARTPGGFHN
jgi:AhpD family alkylhydroperoxidase